MRPIYADLALIVLEEYASSLNGQSFTPFQWDFLKILMGEFGHVAVTSP